MKRTTATNSVAGHYVDRVPGVTPGTILKDEDMNNFLEEIAHPIELLGVTLDGADQYQLEKAIIGLSHVVGEVIEIAIDEDPVKWGDARNNSNPSNPRYLPIVKLWDSDHDLDETNYPLIVQKLRTAKAKAWNGSALVTDHSVTVAGSVITGSGTAWTNLLAGLSEWVLARGGYGSLPPVNVAGTDFAITNVSSGSGTITVTGTPASGAQTAIVYTNRITGSTSTARTFKDSGRATMTPDGIDYIAGFQRRDRLQGHYHSAMSTAGGGSSTVNIPGLGNSSSPPATDADVAKFEVRAPKSDGTHGTPRTGSTTDPNSTIVYRALWVGVYK